jgi:heme/copper-type cytochrome/quinol oxidase subunit 3
VNRAATHTDFGKPLQPPGGMMIWVFIFMELLAFGLAFIVFSVLRGKSLGAFESSQAELSQGLALVVLTVFGFYNSSAPGPTVAYVVLAIGVTKFFLIFMDFMEMKHAHAAWKVAMTLFMLVLFGAISFSL